MAANTLEKWIDDRQTNGRYTFLRSEAVKESGMSSEAVKKAIQRLTKRGRIAKAKDYFYVIVPLEYASAGAPPASWFIDDLMAAMERSYYVGLLTAAGQHGASHHASQEFQVMSTRYIRPIRIGRSMIRFFTSKFAGDAAIENIKTPTGTMRISTIETTVVDLVRFAKSVGYLDNVATVIAELAPSLDSRKLLKAVERVHDVPNTQRLGYMLENVGARKLAQPLRRWIDRRMPKFVPLRTGPLSHAPSQDNDWHLWVDRPLEPEI